MMPSQAHPVPALFKGHTATASPSISQRCARTVLWQQTRVIPHGAPDPPRLALLWSFPENPETENRSGLQLFCDCGLSQNPQSPIGAQNATKTAHLRFAEDREESAIAKKLQKSQDFCFHNELIVEAKADSIKRAKRWNEPDLTLGRIPQKTRGAGGGTRGCGEYCN